MSQSTLTGRWGFRIHKPWFRKPVMVLQVEVEFERWNGDWGGMAGCDIVKVWRDADVNEAMEIYRLHMTDGERMRDRSPEELKTFGVV